MKFSVIIPAHNEEDFIGKCLESIKASSRPYPGDVEVIVCLNRCTDRTEEIARLHGATTTQEDAKNIARIRNQAASLATGRILVTIDADSWMSPTMLSEIDKRLSSGKYIGGGVLMKPDRFSFGILMSLLSMLPYLFLSRVSAGLFWTHREDFEAVGGFDPAVLTAEDIDFGRRLKAYGKKCGKKYGTIWNAHIVTSCRKFDIFGDWFLFKNPLLVRRILGGKDKDVADKVFHDARAQMSRKESDPSSSAE